MASPLSIDKATTRRQALLPTHAVQLRLVPYATGPGQPARARVPRPQRAIADRRQLSLPW